MGQDVSVNGTIRHHGTATIRCMFDNKDPYIVSWFLKGNNTETHMTEECSIEDAGLDILSISTNCQSRLVGSANYEFIIDRLEIGRDVDEAWFCLFNEDKLYLEIPFLEGKSLMK